MGKNYGICSSVDCSKFDYPIFCEFKTIFRLKIGRNFANCPSIFENSSLHMTSYLITCSLYHKMSRFKVFQYEISDRMSYLKALYDNFEIFRKKIFNGKEFSKIEGQFAKFQPIFNLLSLDALFRSC